MLSTKRSYLARAGIVQQIEIDVVHAEVLQLLLDRLQDVLRLVVVRSQLNLLTAQVNNWTFAPWK